MLPNMYVMYLPEVKYGCDTPTAISYLFDHVQSLSYVH